MLVAQQQLKESRDCCLACAMLNQCVPRHQLRLWEVVRMPSIHCMAAVDAQDAEGPPPALDPASQVGRP